MPLLGLALPPSENPRIVDKGCGLVRTVTRPAEVTAASRLLTAPEGQAGTGINAMLPTSVLTTPMPPASRVSSAGRSQRPRRGEEIVTEERAPATRGRTGQAADVRARFERDAMPFLDQLYPAA